MTDMLSARICAHIAEEIAARSSQVEAAVRLLDEGATVPFIARYRKEMTGGLTDAQLRTLEERLVYLRELNDRRETILAAIDAQGKLDDALKERLLKAETKQELEDLYAPYKSKRRTRAAIAKEAGLEPLAEKLLANRTLDPLREAAAFVNAEKGFADAQAALNGARDILAERFSLDAKLRENLRAFMSARGELVSRRTVRLPFFAAAGRVSLRCLWSCLPKMRRLILIPRKRGLPIFSASAEPGAPQICGSLPSAAGHGA